MVKQKQLPEKPLTGKVYKYVRFERWRDLESGYVRFTPPSGLNDPFEMAPVYGEWMSDHVFQEQLIAPLQKLTINAIADMVSDQMWNKLPPHRRTQPEKMSLQKDVRQLALENPRKFKLDYINTMRSKRHGLDYKVSELQGIADKSFGILSLTIAPDNRPMWAHYANNYTGIVIEFNAEHQFFTAVDKGSDFSGLRKIEYNPQRPTSPYFLDEGKNYHALYFVKSRDWDYEQEYRLVKLLKDRNKEVPLPDGSICHLFKFPPECVTGVILGCRMPQHDRDVVTNFIRQDSRYKHVSIYESVQDEKTFDLHRVLMP